MHTEVQNLVLEKNQFLSLYMFEKNFNFLEKDHFYISS